MALFRIDTTGLVHNLYSLVKYVYLGRRVRPLTSVEWKFFLGGLKYDG